MLALINDIKLIPEDMKKELLEVIGVVTRHDATTKGQPPMSASKVRHDSHHAAALGEAGVGVVHAQQTGSAPHWLHLRW